MTGIPLAPLRPTEALASPSVVPDFRTIPSTVAAAGSVTARCNKAIATIKTSRFIEEFSREGDINAVDDACILLFSEIRVVHERNANDDSVSRTSGFLNGLYSAMKST
jgi:hypothetical protein